MEKQKKYFNVNYNFDWECGILISDIRKDLDALEKLGATRIDIEAYESYGSAEIEIEAKCERFETDEEFENRLSLKKRRDEMDKERELAEFEKLKLKYGK